MASLTSRFLFSNGVVSPPAATPPVAAFLEAHPGAYTTSRTHNDASFVLFWDRHLKRLAQSVTILYNSNPQLLFGPHKPSISPPPPLTADSGAIESKLRELVNGSVAQVLPIALKERRDGEELVITTLVSGNSGKLGEIDGVFDVSIHIGSFAPTAFGVGGNGAHLAVVGRGRDVAAAKYSDWVRIRKHLQRFRPPLVTDLLLSNDGDRILEGTVFNFFVVRRKDNSEENGRNMRSFEVQTAPIGEGVLPGIIRQLVMEVCLSKGISFREVAPSWSESELWAEAFITSSLKLVQHVEAISVPNSLESLHSNSWNEVSWEDKHFEDGAGMITTIIQKEIMEKAVSDGYSCSCFI